MPRLRQVPRGETPSEMVGKAYARLFGPDHNPVAEPVTATATPGNWWTVLALSTEVFRHAVAGFSPYQRSAARLDPAPRDLGQMRAGWLAGPKFVYSQHCKSCRALGMNEAEIAAISAWGVSHEFDPLERVNLAYKDAIVGKL